MMNKTMATDKVQLRRQNLSAVLTLTHRSKGVTRADLTRALGLNRSTIGDLVSTLNDAGWVTEVDDAPRESAGRPSPRVVPTDRWLVAAINPEVDAIDIALVALGGRVVSREIHAVSSPSSEEVVEIVSSAISSLKLNHPRSTVVSAGVAIPGLVRRSDGVVRLAPHLGWLETFFGEQLSTALEMRVEVANDAQLGCRAESIFGAGYGAKNLVYLNGGSSGIGGGVIVDGLEVSGRDGHAGEVGHISVDPKGPSCACGASGCLEAVVRKEFLAEALGIAQASDQHLEDSLRQSNASSVRVLVSDQFNWLRVGLRSLVNIFNPEKIVLGGYLAILWNAVDEQMRDGALGEALGASASGVVIETAALGPDRLILGAAELAWDFSLGNPLSS